MPTLVPPEFTNPSTEDSELELNYTVEWQTGKYRDYYSFSENYRNDILKIPYSSTLVAGRNTYDNTHSNSLMLTRINTSRSNYAEITFVIPQNVKNTKLRFLYGVSSEAQYDTFTVTLRNTSQGGTLMSNQMSGVTSPQHLYEYENTSLTPGAYRLELTYAYDSSVEAGMDAGILNELELSYELNIDLSQTQYELQVCETPTSSTDLRWTHLALTEKGATSHRFDTTLLSNNFYYPRYFRIRAVEDSGSSKIYSDWITSMGFYISNIKSPVITSPTLNVIWSGEKRIDFSYTGEGYVFSNLEVQLSTNNGASWKSLVAVKSTSTSFTYNFSAEAETTTAKIRVRAYDSTYAAPWNESPIFTIFHKVLRGMQKVRTKSGTTNIPIYDRWYGMDNIALQIQLNGSLRGAFYLVDTTHALASPVRIKTATGIKAIAKQM